MMMHGVHLGQTQWRQREAGRGVGPQQIPDKPRAVLSLGSGGRSFSGFSLPLCLLENFHSKSKYNTSECCDPGPPRSRGWAKACPSGTQPQGAGLRDSDGSRDVGASQLPPMGPSSGLHSKHLTTACSGV